ncbi:MAG TPA: sensor domain-containing diguanylate cyclase [Lysobacter sp.]|nr:sensor domain-containing diguanylate cyclase [Lysobacter sp.]
MTAVLPKTKLPDHPPSQTASARYGVVDASPELVYDDIALLAAMLCDTPASAIWLLDRRRPWTKAQFGEDYLQCPRASAISSLALDTPMQMLVIEDVARDPRLRAMAVRIDQTPLRFFAGVPLLSHDGYPLGILCVMDMKPRQLTAKQCEGLQALARQIQHLFELRRLGLEQERRLSEGEASSLQLEQARAELEQRHQNLQRTAERDQLTGLLNRTALAQLRENPRAMLKLESAPYSLALLDVDHFKQVNDRHGHLLGDRALRVVAEAVTASIRAGDVAVRYGGEEFLIVLPGTDLTAAFEVAHRIRERVAASSLPFPLTVSAGIAAGDPQRDRPEQVFDRADQALSQAKASGRDRVIADDTPQHRG